MAKLDEVVDIWLDEMRFTFEPFETSIVPSASIIREGDIVEAIGIGYVDEKMATKAKRIVKKRWKVYEKVEGFSYTVEIYNTVEIFDSPLRERYDKWKEAIQLKFANLEEIF